MDTAMVGSRPTKSVLPNSGGCGRFSEAKATARSLVEWAGDDSDREGPGSSGKNSCR